MSGHFVLAAGGTGGHLFPAQALASELMRRGSRVVVMTDGRGHNYRSAFPGAEIATVPAATFAGRSPLGRVLALGVIALGVVSSLAKLRSLRPRAVVGFGGYPSLPVMIAASMARIPSLLHEQNAVLGRVNRLLAPRVLKIAASLPFARFAPKNPERVVSREPVARSRRFSADYGRRSGRSTSSSVRRQSFFARCPSLVPPAHQPA